MIEASIYSYLNTEIPGVEIVWGKNDKNSVFDGLTPIINFIKVPSVMSNYMPVFLDVIQFSIRHKNIDVATEYTNIIIELFQGFYGTMVDYQVWVTDLLFNGTLYEEEDVVSNTLTVSFKYAGL